MATSLFPSDRKTEQISAEQELSLIEQAQRRYKLLLTAQPLSSDDKRIIRQGERALERLLATQARPIESRVQRLFAKMPNLSRADLRQQAQEGMLQAIHSFDFSKGVRLLTWAWYQISSKFRALITGEVQQSNAAQRAKEAPVAHDKPQIDVIELDSAQRVIAKFKPAIQQILTLRTQGHEFPAIGKILGKTADACRMSYNRAIRRIRQQLLPTEVSLQTAPIESWMTKLKLRYGKNVRFGNGVCHNAPRVSRQTMSKRTDKALLAVSGLISLSILGFAAMSVGRVPQCQTQSYNIGLPIFTLILLSIPFLAGLSARGLLNKGVNPSPKRFTQKRYKPSDSSSKSTLKE